jgi:small subunit ribosomal protein S6
MRRYEALIVLDPDMPDDDVKALNERLSGIIKDHAGEIIKLEDWGTRKLAYLVRKKDKGRYILFDFVSGPQLINELERQFKITEDVMKYLTVKLDDEVDLEAFKAKAEKEAVVTEASPEAPTEEAETETAEALTDVVVQETEVTEVLPQSSEELVAEEPAVTEKITSCETPTKEEGL